MLPFKAPGPDACWKYDFLCCLGKISIHSSLLCTRRLILLTGFGLATQSRVSRHCQGSKLGFTIGATVSNSGFKPWLRLKVKAFKRGYWLFSCSAFTEAFYWYMYLFICLFIIYCHLMKGARWVTEPLVFVFHQLLQTTSPWWPRTRRRRSVDTKPRTSRWSAPPREESPRPRYVHLKLHVEHGIFNKRFPSSFRREETEGKSFTCYADF